MTRLHTFWQRPPDAMAFGWTDSGELELLRFCWWDGSDGFVQGSGW